ncbi:hypothetical protein HOC01_05165 [archaeon]|jgi:hypothetical protein|nr:hypothetical protein [archaeon]MBT6698200.1 hypothetical protein [archaeon]
MQEKTAEGVLSRFQYDQTSGQLIINGKHSLEGVSLDFARDFADTNRNLVARAKVLVNDQGLNSVLQVETAAGDYEVNNKNWERTRQSAVIINAQTTYVNRTIQDNGLYEITFSDELKPGPRQTLKVGEYAENRVYFILQDVPEDVMKRVMAGPVWQKGGPWKMLAEVVQDDARRLDKIYRGKESQPFEVYRVDVEGTVYQRNSLPDRFTSSWTITTSKHH